MAVRFLDHKVETLERVEVYSSSDFLAICGGLLGLFLGVSALSIIEFVYYFTLRLFWTIRRARTEILIAPFQEDTTESTTKNSGSTITHQ